MGFDHGLKGDIKQVEKDSYCSLCLSRVRFHMWSCIWGISCRGFGKLSFVSVTISAEPVCCDICSALWLVFELLDSLFCSLRLFVSTRTTQTEHGP